MSQRPKTQRLVRLPFEIDEWLKFRAAEKYTNITTELVGALRDMMSAEPIYAVVHEYDAGDGIHFAAALGESFDDFYEGSCREAAFAAARDKLKQIGSDPRNIEFRKHQKGEVA